jgi:GH35 family endo-1,4-beta-xylanase
MNHFNNLLSITLLGVIMLNSGCNRGKDGWNPYSGKDPGAGIQRIPLSVPEITRDSVLKWEKWRTNDGRILTDTKSSFEYMDNPFEGETGNLVKLTTFYDPEAAGRSFGGFGIRIPLAETVAVNNTDTFFEFDIYYPFSAAGKYMRINIWSTDTGRAGSQEGSGENGSRKAVPYIRTQDLDAIGNLNPEWVSFYNGETWSKKHINIVCASTGEWNYINIDINTESGAQLTGDVLLIGNISITKSDPEGTPIPDVVDMEPSRDVIPIKKKYNKANGMFMVGSIGTGTVTGIRERHYEIFVHGGNLKPEFVHRKAPLWLRDETGFNFIDSIPPNMNAGELPEYSFPTNAYMQIRDSGKPGEYKSHGHVLAWYNQSPSWMRQMVPQNLDMAWNAQGKFYAYGNNATGPFTAVHKDTARRVYFNHIMYVMRHFMTTDTKYSSSVSRGIIPFHSFDVLNEEIHESRHSMLINDNPDEWKSGLKSISWLAAMTDNDFDDIRQHYIYLLFKYAHIAVPNAQMADRYKANCGSLPGYMKLDGHDSGGSIDAYITENPPLLTYNEYDISIYSKAKMAYNMIRELNTAWLTDPLYDGRPLIEIMGIQGHDTLGRTLASDNRRAVAMYAGLVDEGLLTGIAYSELDLKIPNSAPGGGSIAPAVLNQKQADALGYQYALLFKMFAKYAKYIDRVIFWGISGSGFQGSYLLFNHEEYANKGYYAVMDPDRYIKGHSYLASYFKGEYDKIRGK